MEAILVNANYAAQTSLATAPPPTAQWPATSALHRG
jgi:hypothetical protein